MENTLTELENALGMQVEYKAPVSDRPHLVCMCGTQVDLVRNPLEDEASWQGLCGGCGKEWWTQIW